MTQKNGLNGWVKVLGVLITIVVLIVGVLFAWKDNEAAVNSLKQATKTHQEQSGIDFIALKVRTEKDMTELKVDGCNTAQDNETTIAVINNQLAQIMEDIATVRIEQRMDMDQLRDEQKSDTEKIMKAIADGR